MSASRLRLLLCALLLGALAVPLRAQDVILEGSIDTRAVRIARDVIETGNYLRIHRDTVLPATFRTEGDLLVVDADVRLEGTVEGRVAVLGGVLYVRPGARVGGTVASVGGEVYPAATAAVAGVVETSPDVRVEVDFEGDTARVRITRVAYGSRFVLPGILGLRVPTYDRVNGLTLAAGPAYLPTRQPEGPRVDAWLSYRTARGAFGGGASARAPLGRGVRLEARAERATFTNERWARGNLVNTLGSLFFANDYRDYWESDRVALTLARYHEEPLIAGEFAFEPRVTVAGMRDRSLRNRDPWSLFGDFDRVNPSVEETEWASASLGAALRWQGTTTAFVADAGVEQALPGGSIELTQWTVDGLWTMEAMWRHTLSVRFRGMGTLGDEPAPPQRRTFIGGPPTLPTFETASFRGDRLAYVRSTYGIPLPQRWALPVLGPPSLGFTHIAGMAWLTGTPMPDWEQNLGGGLFFSLVRAEVWVNPAEDDLDPTFRLGVELPWP